MRCNVYLNSLCSWHYSRCIDGHGSNHFPHLRNADCEERDPKCMGLHSHFLCILECNIIMVKKYRIGFQIWHIGS